MAETDRSQDVEPEVHLEGAGSERLATESAEADSAEADSAEGAGADSEF